MAVIRLIARIKGENNAMSYSDKLRLFNQAQKLLLRLVDKGGEADERAFYAAMDSDDEELSHQAELVDRFTRTGVRATERATRRELDVAGNVELN